MKFLDEAKIFIQSEMEVRDPKFRREKFIEFGGPDGGDGGRGGNVYAFGCQQFEYFNRLSLSAAFSGFKRPSGMGRNRHGADSDDIILKVPAGTQIFENDKETLIADLKESGQKVLLIKAEMGIW